MWVHIGPVCSSHAFPLSRTRMQASTHALWIIIHVCNVSLTFFHPSSLEFRSMRAQRVIDADAAALTAIALDQCCRSITKKNALNMHTQETYRENSGPPAFPPLLRKRNSSSTFSGVITSHHIKDLHVMAVTRRWLFVAFLYWHFNNNKKHQRCVCTHSTHQEQNDGGEHTKKTR